MSGFGNAVVGLPCRERLQLVLVAMEALPAIYRHRFTGDIGGHRACEEKGHPGDFIGGAQSFHGDRIRDALEEFRRIMVQTGGLDNSRCDSVDPDIETAPFHCKGFGQVVHAGTGSTSMRHTRNAAVDIDDDVDDCALSLGDKKSLCHLLRHIPGAIEVIVDYGKPTFFADIFGGGGELPPGIVDQDIEPPGIVHNAVGQLFDLFGIPDITGHIIAGAVFAQDIGSYFQFFFFSRGNQHTGAQLQQLLADGEAYSCATAGNKCCFSFKKIW